MPVYDYLCSFCDHRADILHGINDPGPKFCPSCGREGTMRKQFTTPTIHFKGSGWAKKDRGGSSSTRAENAASSSGSASSGGESKSGDHDGGGHDGGESKSGDHDGGGHDGPGGHADRPASGSGDSTGTSGSGTSSSPGSGGSSSSTSGD